MKKILFVTGNLAQGGAERVISILGNSLCEKDYQISIALIYNKNISYSINEGINILLPKNKSKYRIIKIAQIIHELRTNIIKEKPDVIISFIENVNIYSILAVRGNKQKLIVSVRNDPSKEPNNKFMRLLRNILYKKVDFIICQTIDSTLYFKKQIQDKCIIIRNPVSITKSRNYINNPNTKSIVTVGRLTEQKNLFFLIDVFSQFVSTHSDYTLDIYGEGHLKHELVNYAKQLNLQNKINFHGYQTDIYTRIINSEIFMLLSIYEGMPNALIEAMALGIPSISSDCPIGGPRDVIKQNENGILVPINDLNATLKALESLTNNSILYEHISFNSRQIISTLNSDEIIEKWIEVINKKNGGKINDE